MFKKFFSILLIFCTINFISLPAFADEETYNTSHVINAKFKTDLDVNKSSKGQVVEFVSTEDYNIDGLAVPSGTIFCGEIKHMKKSRFGYRRAKATIKINQIILPNGETHSINAYTKRHVLKGSAVGNVAKGVVSLPFAVVTGTVGVVVIIVEAISIAGIILIGPTSYAFGEAMGKLTHGVNCKKHQGDDIQLKVKSL